MGAGHERKARPELYIEKWTVQHDLVLVGDLIQSCSTLDIDAEGQDLLRPSWGDDDINGIATPMAGVTDMCPRTT